MLSSKLAHAPIRRSLIAIHALAIGIFAALSAVLYGGQMDRVPPDVIAAGWITAAAVAVLSIGLALMPGTLWLELIYGTRRLAPYVLAASLAACYAATMSWALWEPAAKLTFHLVRLILSPFVQNMIVQPAIRRVGTPRFTVRISPECSGLEGLALLLVFGLLWLVLFRDEIRFPASLLLLPAGALILFLLNAVRIAALVLIGHAGAPEIAAGGFHSQAGWIAFSCVAFGLSIGARRVPWFVKPAPEREPSVDAVDNPTAAYLVPFLMILAAGFLSRAASGSFEWLYSLRFFAALIALWVFRRRYVGIDWRCGWLGPLAGAIVFFLWIALDRLTIAVPGSNQMPTALATAPQGARILWITLRVAAAAVTVPIAEELAFRGYLLRRFVSVDFENVSFRTFTWFSLFGSSVLFGLLHGRRWVAGAAAGALYATVSLRTGKLGEAVVAHATTNAFLAAFVLVFQKWSLW